MKFKIIIIFFLFSISFLSANAQSQQVIDSLSNKIKTANDTTEINLLNEIADLYINNHPDSSLKYVNIALKKAKLINFESGLANTYEILGEYYFYIGAYNLSKDNYNKSLEIYEKYKNENKIAFILIGKAAIHIIQNEYLEAFNLLNKAKKLGNEEMVSQCNYTFAYLYSKIENYEKAMNHILLSLKYYESQKDSFQIAHCNNVIGHIYLNTNKDSLSLILFNNALKIYKNRSQKDYAFVLGNIGIILKKQEKYNEAIDIQLQVVEVLKEQDDFFHLSNTYKNLGEIFEELNKFSEAEHYFNLSKDINIFLNDSNSLALDYYNLGELYKTSNNIDKSLNFFNKSVTISEKFHIATLLKKVYYSLFEIYFQKNNTNTALEYHIKYLRIKDSLFTIEKERTFQNIMIAYETEKKEQQIISLNKENELKQETIAKQKQIKYYLLLFLFFIFIIAIIFLLLFIQKNKMLLKLVQQNKAIIVAEQELGVNIDNKEKFNNYNLDNTKENLAEKLLISMEKQQVFLNKDITLSLLAKKLNTNTSYLSKTINEIFDSNFNNFINDYRIKYACILISNKEYERFTINSISKKSGFNNNTTFIAAFKKNTGVTPSFYIKNLKTKDK